MTPWIGLCFWLSLFMSTVVLIPISRIWPEYQQQTEGKIEDKLAKTRESLLTIGTRISFDKAFVANANWGYQHSLQQSLNALVAPGRIDAIWLFSSDCQVLAASSVRNLSQPNCRELNELGKVVAASTSENEQNKSVFMLNLPFNLAQTKTGIVSLIATLDDQWLKSPPHLSQGQHSYEIRYDAGNEPDGLTVFSGSALNPPDTRFRVVTKDSWLSFCQKFSTWITTAQLWALSLLWGALALAQLLWIGLRKSKQEQKNRLSLMKFATWCAEQEPLGHESMAVSTRAEQLVYGGLPAIEAFLQQQLRQSQKELRAAKDRNVTLADRLAFIQSLNDDQYSRIQELIPESLKGSTLRERMEYTAAHMIGLGQSTLAPLKTNLEAIKDQIFGQHLILVEWNEHLSAVGIRKFLKEALESEKEFTNPSFSRELQRLAQTSQELCLKLKTQIHLQQCVEEKLLLLCEQLHETIAEAAVDWVGKLTWSELFQRIDRSLKNFFPADHTNLEWDASLLQKDQTFAPPPFDLATLQQLILLGSAALATQSQSLLEPRNLRFSIRFFHPGSRSGLKLKLVRHSALGGHYMVLPADGQRYIQLMQMHLGLKAASVTLEPDSGNGAVILISWERPMDLRQSLRQNLQKSPSLHHD